VHILRRTEVILKVFSDFFLHLQLLPVFIRF